MSSVNVLSVGFLLLVIWAFFFRPKISDKVRDFNAVKNASVKFFARKRKRKVSIRNFFKRKIPLSNFCRFLIRHSNIFCNRQNRTFRAKRKTVLFSKQFQKRKFLRFRKSAQRHRIFNRRRNGARRFRIKRFFVRGFFSNR